ncbi:MAG: energy transducer TonB [Parvibaculum sp.]
MNIAGVSNGAGATGSGSRPAWGGGAIFAVAVHAAAAAAIAFWAFGHEPPPQVAAAITLDLAPMVSAPPEPETEAPMGPLKEETPPEEIVEPEPLPEPPLPRIEPADIPEPVKEKPKEETAKEVVKETTAPPAMQAPKTEAVTAPVNAPPSAAELRAMPTYEQMLLAHLERYKKYPRSARRRMQEGTAWLFFEIDRDGNVLSYRLNQSSGYTLLDEEVLAMVKRAEPLPALPPEIPGATREFKVPVVFNLN